MGKWNLFGTKKTIETKKKEIRYILTIDGGGMRGVVPAYLLSRINKKLKEYSDRPLYSYFDLICGTSTGALIALGLSYPERSMLTHEDGPSFPVYEKKTYKKFFRTYEEEILKGYIEKGTDPDSMVKLYRDNGYKIFHQPSHFKKLIGNVFSDKYDARSIEVFLNEIYKDTPMEDALVPTMATAFDPLTSKPYTFSSFDSHGFLVKEAARASSAAPTYFSPITLVDRTDDTTHTLVDGGLCANNPVLMAYSKARQLYPNADEFRLISLSTCSLSASFDPSASSGGVATWISSLWKSYASGTMELADDIANSIKDLKYLRIWDDVVEKKFGLDDYSDESMETLLKSAEKLYTIKEDMINEYIDDLVKNANTDQIKMKAKEEAPLLIES